MKDRKYDRTGDVSVEQPRFCVCFSARTVLLTKARSMLDEPCSNMMDFAAHVDCCWLASDLRMTWKTSEDSSMWLSHCRIVKGDILDSCST